MCSYTCLKKAEQSMEMNKYELRWAGDGLILVRFLQAASFTTGEYYLTHF